MVHDPRYWSPSTTLPPPDKGYPEPLAASQHVVELENGLWHKSRRAYTRSKDESEVAAAPPSASAKRLRLDATNGQDDCPTSGDGPFGPESSAGDATGQPGPPQRAVQIHQIAYEKLCRTVGSFPHERGGIFVSRVGPFYIEDFIFDDISEQAGAVYYPHAEYLNGIVERQYEPLGFFFVGLGHSHPPGIWHPSGHAGWGDVKAARNNLKSNENLDALFIPIVESQATTGTFRLHPYVMLRDGLRICPVRVEIVHGSHPSGNH
jgi:hypothetical protein